MSIHCKMNENPCSNQEIHVLFEHGFELENILCIISFTNFLCLAYFYVHLSAVPINFKCNDENRILGK